MTAPWVTATASGETNDQRSAGGRYRGRRRRYRPPATAGRRPPLAGGGDDAGGGRGRRLIRPGGWRLISSLVAARGRCRRCSAGGGATGRAVEMRPLLVALRASHGWRTRAGQLVVDSSRPPATARAAGGTKTGNLRGL